MATVTMCDIDDCENYDNVLQSSEEFRIKYNGDAYDVCTDCAHYYMRKYPDVYLTLDDHVLDIKGN